MARIACDGGRHEVVCRRVEERDVARAIHEKSVEIRALLNALDRDRTVTIVGDVLVVVNAAPNGDARVTLSCPCQQLLLGSD